MSVYFGEATYHGGGLEAMYKLYGDKRPVEYQEIFSTTAKEANHREALKTIIDSGTKLTPYPPEILQVAQKAAVVYYTEESNKSPSFKTVYEQWNQFRILISD